MRRPLAIAYRSTPAWVRGLVVVHRLTCSNAWKVHLCTLVSGHTARLALSNPLPPSVTMTSGGVMRAMRAARACELSLLARCQPTMCPSVHAIGTTQLRLSQMPSTWTTRWTSPHSGAVGHRDQNSEVRLLKVLAGIPIWAWARFDRSQSRKRASMLALLL